jgi:hypothetical protein
MNRLFLYTRFLLIIGAFFVLGILIWLLFPAGYNIKRMPVAANMTAYELFDTYVADPPYAHFLYAGKVILIEGTLEDIGEDYVLMGSGMRVVRCELRNTIYDRKSLLKKGDKVIMKGICRGITLTEVLLTQCVLVRNYK